MNTTTEIKERTATERVWHLHELTWDQLKALRDICELAGASPHQAIHSIGTQGYHELAALARPLRDATEQTFARSTSHDEI